MDTDARPTTSAPTAAETEVPAEEQFLPEPDQGEDEAEGAGVVELSELLRQRDERVNELEEQVRRVSADFENFRRRQTEEQKRVLGRIRDDLFRSLLPISDHLERAIEAAQGRTSAEGLLKGVELIRRDVLKIFEEHGVAPIDSEGVVFDPAFHEAVLTDEREDVPDQTIIQELQRGYTIGNRVLRPAMVKVARNS